MYNEDAILTTVKQSLGIDNMYTVFDPDLVTHINSALGIMYQIGVGKKGYFIDTTGGSWSEFLGDNPLLEMVKTYVCLKVKSIFDPPTSGTVSNALNSTLAELEFRIYCLATEK